ncbi:hypothetical protein FRACYDRAFT_240676 [Fragilariopsis cylindrus CCMP1102]|uniref:Uncharacterized protein n=1 Tax=Fragilariopsis cylindrus CCMP1102 TaxID=635003 RepID=A0A1E7FCS7_9STRA|nr:hypothetical protein FRACYDRAFT_240676 [Fragilariopsis cylindrus CCMP1102]|eukprot:OEU15978.1 hypothetical protein FRACYDRAFT_240676 [Fragilariopsis cylindrus CCMP1102]
MKQLHWRKNPTTTTSTLNDDDDDDDDDEWTPDVIFGNYSMPITFDDYDYDIDDYGDSSKSSRSNSDIQTTFDTGLMECYGFASLEARKTASKLLSYTTTQTATTTTTTTSFFSWKKKSEEELLYHRHLYYCPMCYWLLAMGYSPFINDPIISNISDYENAATAASIAFKEAHHHHNNNNTNNTSSNNSNRSSTSSTTTVEERSSSPSQLSFKELGLIDAMNVRFRSSFDNQTIGYHDNITPYPEIAYAITLLEDCLQQSPDHPLCQHLYIHVTEPSDKITTNKVASNVADNLYRGSNASEAQHLQHMPSHIYLRIGRYHDAVTSNIIAHESDEKYLNSQYNGGGTPYGPGHDIAFLIYAAQHSGERTTAYRYSNILRNHYRKYPTKPDGPGTEQGWNIWRTVRLRFGDYQSVLNDNDDIDVNNTIVNGIIDTIDDDAKNSSNSNIQWPGMARVANLTLTSAIEYYKYRYDYDIVLPIEEILATIRKARIEQESWSYTEPPSWFNSVALCEGTLLRILGQYDEAVLTFQRDLEIIPESRYGLFGLKEAMVAAGTYSTKEVKDVSKRFNKASYWSDSSIRNSVPLVCPEFGE